MCPVLSSQVTGRASLQATTLQSLGLTGGSAIIRWGSLGVMLSGRTGSEGKEGKVRGNVPHPHHGPLPSIWGPCLMAAPAQGPVPPWPAGGAEADRLRVAEVGLVVARGE